MIPGNVDQRRPEKIQRYKPPQSNGNPPVEDLTPDYMNILGPDSATANAEATETVKSADPQQTEDPSASVQEPTVQTSNGTNVIPTSPQYGVAIMSNDVPSETTTSSTDTVVETTAKCEGEHKDMHSTPSRNDRFKVVKIASLEPFRRGRWKCMDYVDENPPPVTTQSKSSQSSSNLQMSGNMYMQTQSLPQQHFQQMLVQGAFATTNQPQFYQNLQSQIIPPSQYFYPAQNVANIQQMPVQPNAIQPQQFINANQQYFPANVHPPHSGGYTSYSNVQYVPSNLMQNQNSAFVPTTQNVNAQLPPNFQQSQTYAGPPSGAQPMVNGHTYPPSEPQVVASSLPTQVAKNVILNATIPPTQINQTIQPNIVSSNQISQSQVNVVQNQQFNQVPNSAAYQPATIPPTNTPQNITQVTPVASTVTPVVPVVSAPSINQITSTVNQVPASANAVPATGTIPSQTAISVNLAQIPNVVPQNFDQNLPTNVYTNPQFVASVNSIPVAENSDTPGDNTEATTESENPSGEDPTKANPVVNAIDNKIEQAMDLVKSHLMYTVREEVEVLKEKIAELMERIQQLETENNFLKQQIPKGLNNNPSGTPDPPQ